MESKLLRSEISTLDFYLHSLSLFMQNSFGMADRCEARFDVLMNIKTIGDEIFSLMNVWALEAASNQDYNSINSERATAGLDILGSIFNLTRTFNITYYDNGIQNRVITLTNDDFLTYIQFTIAKYAFNGTNSDLLKRYNTTNTDVLYYNLYENNSYYANYLTYLTNNAQNNDNKIGSLNIFYAQDNDNPLTCNIYMNLNASVSNNIKYLFLGGYLTIESLGIVYNRNIVPGAYYGYFYNSDSTDTTNARFYISPLLNDTNANNQSVFCTDDYGV